MSGVPAVVTMKHVGLNVAADPFFSSAYTGVEAPLLVISADDPGMWSSQNEQDNRWYGVHAYIPVVEPAGAQEAREAALEALRLSGDLKHPVLLRLVTRVSHTRAPVTLGALSKPKLKGSFKSNPSRWNLIPAHARRLKEELLDRWRRAEELVSKSWLNVAEGPEDSKVLVVGVGLGYRYVREALRRLKANVRVAKITTPVPIPAELLLREVKGRDAVLVVEEGDPVFEMLLKTLLQEAGLNVRVYGKRTGHLRASGELRLEYVEKALAQVVGLDYKGPEPLEPPYSLRQDLQSYAPGALIEVYSMPLGKPLRGLT
jgi:Indolepyruvate ferredoxin oxidoreductase, alpha and beta subunits